VLFPEAKVEVTDCTTWETVIVFVSVAVEVMVVVEESAAARPRRRREGRRVVRRILNTLCRGVWTEIQSLYGQDAMRRCDRQSTI
jgi:hypothetical protein